MKKRTLRQGFLFLFMLAMLANIILSVYIYASKLVGISGGDGGSCFAADVGECLKVQLSSYAYIFGIPLSIYGAAFFLLLFLFFLALFMESEAHWFGKAAGKYAKHVRMVLVILLIWGGIFSLWLVGLQFFIIKELCKFCLWVDGITLGSAIIFLWMFSREMFD